MKLKIIFDTIEQQIEAQFMEIDQEVNVRFSESDQQFDVDFGEIFPVGDASQLPVYSGDYVVEPGVEGQLLHTAQKVMKSDLAVTAISFINVSNGAGGNTIYIG